MVIRNGRINDVDNIMVIIKEASKDMNEKGIYQWDSIYPNEDVITSDINENNLYVYIDENDVILGLIVLNEDQESEYKTINWEYKSGKQLVIHRLCIHHKYQGKGVARLLIRFAEDLALNKGYEAIRLDAFIPNTRACKMYEQLGYKRRGVITFRKGNFYCYEKYISLLDREI